MLTKTKLKTKTALKTKQPKSVRIVIDQKLAEVISEVQSQLPLLSTAEAVKVVLSKGVNSYHQNKQFFLSFLKTLPKPKINISEEDGFRLLNEL
jgi:hypothetical protein